MMKHKHPPKKKTNPYVLLIVSLLLVVVFGLIFLSSEQLVGQAFVKGTVNAGLLSSDNVLEVWANVGTKETLGVQFTLRLPPGVTCTHVVGGKVDSKLGWTADNGFVENKNECIPDSILGHKIEFDQFILDEDEIKTGEFKVAEINFKDLDKGTYDFKFSSFKIHDGDNFVITSGDGVSLTLGEAKSCDGYEKFGEINTIGYAEFDFKLQQASDNACVKRLLETHNPEIMNTQLGNECVEIYKGVPITKGEKDGTVFYKIVHVIETWDSQGKVYDGFAVPGIPPEGFCPNMRKQHIAYTDGVGYSQFPTLEDVRKCIDEGISLGNSPSDLSVDKLLTCQPPPETDVYGCKVLDNREETYTLKDDVYFGGIAGDVCFSIERNDVTLDCNGYTISGLTSKNQKVSEAKDFKDAVEIKSDGVTVQNCDFEYVGTGIKVNELISTTSSFSFSTGEGGKSETTTEYSSTTRKNIVVVDNTFASSKEGISIINAEDVLVKGNELTSIGSGFGTLSVRNSKNILIDGNELINTLGIGLSENSNATVSQNYVEVGVISVFNEEGTFVDSNEIRNGSLSLMKADKANINNNIVCNLKGKDHNTAYTICLSSPAVTGTGNYFGNTTFYASDGIFKSVICDWPTSTDYQSCDKVPTPTPPTPIDPKDEPPKIDDKKDTSSTSSSTNRGGFKSKCNWDCEYWTPCNGTLQQERTCFPGRRCYAKPKVEIKSCKTCNPSWFCGSWSDSVNDCGTRTCVDERSCGISFGKPVTSKTCPTKVTLQSPAPVTGVSGGYIPLSTSPGVWSTYKNIILGSVLGLALVGILISIVVYFMMHKKGPEVGPLISWIKTMRGRKASDSQIKQILRDQGSWHAEDIKEAFRKIK